jgi:hypothetical protein
MRIGIYDYYQEKTTMNEIGNSLDFIQINQSIPDIYYLYVNYKDDTNSSFHHSKGTFP